MNHSNPSRRHTLENQGNKWILWLFKLLCDGSIGSLLCWTPENDQAFKIKKLMDVPIQAIMFLSNYTQKLPITTLVSSLSNKINLLSWSWKLPNFIGLSHNGNTGLCYLVPKSLFLLILVEKCCQRVDALLKTVVYIVGFWKMSHPTRLVCYITP